MTRYTNVIDKVKEILEDEEKMKKICAFKQTELDSFLTVRKKKYRLKTILENAQYQSKASTHIPEDLQNFFDNCIDEDGMVEVQDIQRIIISIPDHEDDINLLMRQRIENLLEQADFSIAKFKDVNSKLEEYENALSVNNRGYSPYYKRDVAETMVNTYNPEWISA
jgi:hypothetical protein